MGPFCAEVIVDPINVTVTVILEFQMSSARSEDMFSLVQGKRKRKLAEAPPPYHAIYGNSANPHAITP